MTTARHEAPEHPGPAQVRVIEARLAPVLVSELCDADLSARSPHLRLYRRDARIELLEVAS